jgi:P-type conjugative transfer protein TrbG
VTLNVKRFYRECAVKLGIAALLTWSGALGAQATAGNDSAVDPIAIAEQEAARGWSARTVRSGDAVVFPFGRTQPTVTCAPLRACVIQLEAGETVLGSAAGDAERWLIDRTVTGNGGRTVLVIIKPTACDLTSNLVISTDRRVYDLTLSSPPCTGKGGAAGDVYVRHVSFYYPDALVSRESTGAIGNPSLAGMRGVDGAAELGSLNFGYQWKPDRHVHWNPVAVYDDGVHGYIKLPAAAAHDELPAVFLVGEDKKLAVLNYTVVGGNTFVTDRVFDRIALVVGANGKDGRVDIVNDRVIERR